MDAQTLWQRRIPMSAAIAGIAVIVVVSALAAADMLRRTPQPVETHEASSAGSIRTVGTPWLLSRAEARFLVRRGATAAELAAQNQQQWRRLQLRMLDDPWVMGLLRHRPGMTMVDLVGLYLSRR
jgi:hypothetical protein